MHSRLFRTILLFAVLVCLVSWSGVVTVRATAHPTPPHRSFSPSGHGIAVPKEISTDTTPQVQDTGPGILLQHPLASSRPPVPAPSNVVSVPPASSSDLSAHQGLPKTVKQQPDANGAGGLLNYLETVNRSLGIYSRSGTQQYSTSFQAWFRAPGALLYQPVAIWDNTANRFIFSVDNSGSSLLLSVAQQTNAIGKYCNYTFRTPSGLLADFDKLGVDSDGIYLSANVLDSNGNVMSNELFFASRTALESCQKASYTSWQGLTNPDGSLAQAITPARQDTSAGGVEYLVNSYPAGACQLTLWTLTSGASLSNTTVPTQCYSPPPPAKQKGTTARLIAGDCSITQASYLNGLLTLDSVGSYDWGDGNGPVGIVEWFVLNPSAASVSSQGAFGTPGYWLYYPSAITTANGHMLFVYDASGPSLYPSIWYVNQTLTGTTALANGGGSYGDPGTIKAWGDYQSAWPDVSGGSPNAVWITGAYIKATNVGATRFDLVSP